jgi:MFS family permease
MTSYDVLEAVALFVTVGLMLYLPRRFSRRRRVIAGVAFFVFGLAGIFLGLALDDQPFLQNERVAFAWMGSCSAATVLSIVLLVPAAFEWFRAIRPRRKRRERWPAR